MTRAELARELRKDAEWLRGNTRDPLVSLGERWKYVNRNLELAAYLLEDDSVERDARRYQLLKQIIESQGDTFAIAERVAISGDLHFLKWDDLLPDVDAAIDAWIAANAARPDTQSGGGR